MGREEFETLHPAVRWVYRPGGQIGSFVVLLLPVSVENYIWRAHLGEDYVVVTESGSTSETAIAWFDPSYALSLKDGSPTFGRAGDERGFDFVSMDYDESHERHIGTLPNGLGVAVQGRRLLMGADPRKEQEMVEVAALREGEFFSQCLDAAEAPGNLLLLEMSRYLICIDLSELPTQAAPQAEAGQAPPAAVPLKRMQRFRFKDFAVGIWRTPPVLAFARDAEKKAAAQRYFQHCIDLGLTVLKTCHAESPEPWLQAAEKFDMPIIIHAHKGEQDAWGPDYPPGTASGYVRFGPFKWLYSKYGSRPNVVGYLLNDNCGLHGYTVAIARYLLEKDTGAVAWISTNPSPAGQAKVPMPVVTSQLYAYLGSGRVLQNADALAARKKAEPQRRLRLCNGLERDRANANRYNQAIWPLLICSGVSPARLRFQCYASLAYGAQGIWYFHVFGVLAPSKAPGVWLKPTDLYGPMKAIHPRVLACGRQLLGHRSVGVFHTGQDVPRAALKLGPGKLIESMSDSLMAGVLIPEEAFARGVREQVAVMVVDKRTMEPDEPPRAPRLKFGRQVRAVEAFEPGGKDSVWRACEADEDGWTRLPALRGGQGVLLRLDAQPQAMAPMISPPVLYFEGTIQVTLRPADGQVIRYTLDGSTPTADSSAYKGPITLRETAMVRARALSADRNVLPSLTTSKEFRKVDRMVRVDRQIDFAWQHGSPGGGIPENNFAVVWTGFVRPTETRHATFHVVADDGVRLWVAGRKVLDDWSVHGERESTGKVFLTAGKTVPVRLEYFERNGYATIKLLWSADGVSKQVVPGKCLFVDQACKQAGLRGTYRIIPTPQ
jgi:hypothetical protein